MFEPRISETFSLQMNFPRGWRHEHPRNRGQVAGALEELVGFLRGFFPEYFRMERFVDAEYSGIRIFGVAKDVDIRILMRVVELDLPKVLSGLDNLVIVGPFKKSVVNELIHISDVKPKGAPVIVKPKRFLSAKNLSRLEKHFLVHLVLSRGGELFLEISERGDRLHYGGRFGNLSVESFDLELKRYELELLRKRESTYETASFLSLMNTFERDELTFDGILRDLKNIRVKEVEGVLETLKNISRSLTR